MESLEYLDNGFINFRNEKYICIKEQILKIAATNLDISFQLVKNSNICDELGLNLSAKGIVKDANKIQLFGDLPMPTICNILFKSLSKESELSYIQFINKEKDIKSGDLLIYLSEEKIDFISKFINKNNIYRMQIDVKFDNLYVKYSEYNTRSKKPYTSLFLMGSKNNVYQGKLVNMNCFQAIYK